MRSCIRFSRLFLRLTVLVVAQSKLEEFKQANPAMTHGANVSFKTIGEMQKFVERYPQMHKMKDNVSKHVNLLQCLSKIVDRRELMAVSELEQQLACVQDHKGAFKHLVSMLGGEGGTNYKITDKDKMRLVMLYVLRYQVRLRDTLAPHTAF